MKYIIISDADNTLWDTNAVFEQAQLAALATLAERGEDAGNLGLKRLRRVDLLLTQKLGKHEYDFEKLAIGLMLAADGFEDERAVEVVAGNGTGTDPERVVAARRFGQTFRRILSDGLPPLLPGAESLFRWLKLELASVPRRAVSVLYSEGDATRIRRIVREHKLDQGYFDLTEIVEEKNVAALDRVATRGRDILGDEPARLICLGDSLSKDIAPAKSIGAITLYKPAGFLGRETPADPSQEPSYRVDGLRKALQIISSLVASRD